MQFGHAHAVLAHNRGFDGLGPADREVLSAWIAAVRHAGIDGAEDLSARSWQTPVAGNVIGVFKAGHLLASWLVVEQGSAWAVACCGDGAVSQPFENLAEALALICPAEATVRVP